MERDFQAEPKQGRKAISIKFEISEINKELAKAKYDLEAQIMDLSGSLYRQLEVTKQEILDASVARVKEEKENKLSVPCSVYRMKSCWPLASTKTN